MEPDITPTEARGGVVSGPRDHRAHGVYWWRAVCAGLRLVDFLSHLGFRFTGCVCRD